MAEQEDLVGTVEVHPIFDNRFWWRIARDGVTEEASEVSYATREEAQAALEAALAELKPP